MFSLQSLFNLFFFKFLSTCRPKGIWDCKYNFAYCPYYCKYIFTFKHVVMFQNFVVKTMCNVVFKSKALIHLFKEVNIYFKKIHASPKRVKAIFNIILKIVLTISINFYDLQMPLGDFMCSFHIV